MITRSKKWCLLHEILQIKILVICIYMLQNKLHKHFFLLDYATPLCLLTCYCAQCSTSSIHIQNIMFFSHKLSEVNCVGLYYKWGVIIKITSSCVGIIPEKLHLPWKNRESTNLLNHLLCGVLQVHSPSLNCRETRGSIVPGIKGGSWGRSHRS